MPPLGTYLICGEAGSGLPGAPTMTYSLLVVAATGTVSGHVEISQAVKDGNISVRVTGKLLHSLPPLGTFITLEGTDVYYCPPPALCVVQMKFHAVLSLDGKGNGQASFTYGPHTVDNVPVKGHPCKMVPMPS